MRIVFTRPAKPADAAFIEGFSGECRDEYLNLHWFETLDSARQIVEAWRIVYNKSGPHMALNKLTPAAYEVQAQDSEN